MRLNVLPIKYSFESIGHFLRQGCRRLGFAALLLFLALGLAPAALAQSPAVNLTASNNAPNPVPVGQDFEYTVNYSVVSTVGDAQNVVLTSVLPAGVTFRSLIPSVHVASTTTPAVGANGSIVFTMNTPLAAGSSGTITITARYAEGTVADNTVSTMTTTATGTGIVSTPKSTVTTSDANNLWSVDKIGPAAGNLNAPVTYTLNVNRVSPGNLNLTGGVLTDTLPIGVLPSDVTNADGGTVSGTGLAGNPTIITWAIPAQNAGATGAVVTRSPTVIFSTARFTAPTTQINSTQLVATALGGVVSTTTDTVSTNFTYLAASPAATTGKTNSDASVTDGQVMTWSVAAANTGTGDAALDAFTVTDVMSPNFNLQRLLLPSAFTNSPGGSFMTVQYKRSDTATTLHTWPGGPFAANATLLVSALSLPVGVQVSEVRINCGYCACRLHHY